MSTTGHHPGLTFSNALRQHQTRFPQHHLSQHPQHTQHQTNPANTKQSPSLSQHTSPYPQHPYHHQASQPASGLTHHHQTHQSPYTHHLFPTPSQPQIPNVGPNIQNATGRQSSTTATTHIPPPISAAPRQRPAPRQTQPQQSSSSLGGYLQQSSMGQTSMTTPNMTPSMNSMSSMTPTLTPSMTPTPGSMTPQSLHSQTMGTPQPVHSQAMSTPQLSQSHLAQSSLGAPLQQTMSSGSLASGPQLPQQQLGSSSLTHQSTMSHALHAMHSAHSNDTSMLQQQPSSHASSQSTLPPAQSMQQHVQQQAQQVQQQVPQVSHQVQHHQVQQQVPKAAPQQTQQAPQVQHLVQQPQPQPQHQPSPQVVQPQVQNQVQQQQAQQQPQQQQQSDSMALVRVGGSTGQGQSSQNDDEMDATSQDDVETIERVPDNRLVEASPFIPRQPMGPMMSAPPEGGSFPTLEAIHKHVLAYCTSVGYAVVIGRSKKTVPGLKKVLFVCDRAGKPPSRVSPEMRKRKTTSRKCDCPFGFFAIEQRTQWTVRYRPSEAHLKHNHGPSESPLLHPAARKLDSKMVAAVKKLKDDGVGVSQTLEILQNENPHVPLLPRDIYNARAAISRNPDKVASALAENRPAIYSKPQPSAEERIRADLRRELQKAKEELEKVKSDSEKQVEALKKELEEKNKIIAKFEEFIDMCNQRVMVGLARKESERQSGAAAS